MAFLTQSPSPLSSEPDRGESIELLAFLLIGLGSDSGLSRSHGIPLILEELSTTLLFLRQSLLHPERFPPEIGGSNAHAHPHFSPLLLASSSFVTVISLPSPQVQGRSLQMEGDGTPASVDKTQHVSVDSLTCLGRSELEHSTLESGLF